MLEHLCWARNHVEVVYDPVDSHAATHFEDTPELRPAVVEALGTMSITGDRLFLKHDMGRIVGTTDLVATTDKDEIIYAKRKHRETYTRFTKSRSPQPCTQIVMFLERQTDYMYKLSSAWIGYGGPSLPGEAEETPDSRPYWDKHALVWGRQEIQPGTETTVCPWK